MCDVSLIIVSWNARRYLLDCLGSIPAGLSRYGGETLVVDNLSTDGGPREVEACYPQVKLIRNQENLGFAKANNIGIRASRGRYVCLVNSDVTLLPGCLDRLIEFMDAHPHIGIVGPKILNPDRTLQASCWDFPSVPGALRRTLALDSAQARVRRHLPLPATNGPEATAQQVEVLSGCCLLIRRRALDQVGLLDEGFFMYDEDVDLCRRFHEARWRVVYYTGAQAIHAGGASSANAPVRFFLELQKADLRYWAKHHGPLGKGFYRLNTLLHHLLRLIPQSFLYLVRPSRRMALKPKLERSSACIGWLLLGSKRKVS